MITLPQWKKFLKRLGSCDDCDVSANIAYLNVYIAPRQFFNRVARTSCFRAEGIERTGSVKAGLVKTSS